MSSPTYDLVIIGSGPAGQKAAFCAAKLGRRVALVERNGGIGGGCIHTGTVPSKAMREAVLHLTGLRERGMYGHAYTVKEDVGSASADGIFGTGQSFVYRKFRPLKRTLRLAEICRWQILVSDEKAVGGTPTLPL